MINRNEHYFCGDGCGTTASHMLPQQHLLITNFTWTWWNRIWYYIFASTEPQDHVIRSLFPPVAPGYCRCLCVCLWGNWSWPSRSNWTQKSKFTPFWACPRDKSPQIEVKITKFGTKMHLSTVNVPNDFGLHWPWSWVSFYSPAQRSWKGIYWNEIVRLSVRLWSQPRYCSPGRNSSPIAVKLDRDVPWVTISDEFVNGRCGSLNERLTRQLIILTCYACYRSSGCNSSLITVKLGRYVPWVNISDEFVHGRCGSLNERLAS